MGVEFERVNAGATEESLAALEATCGFALEKSYRRFLAAGDGGVPAPNLFDVGTDNDSGVSRLFSAAQVTSEFALMGSRIGADLLPVADAEGGNYVCLDPDGAVWFWDHEFEGSSGARVPLASSFAEFWDGKVRSDDE